VRASLPKFAGQSLLLRRAWRAENPPRASGTGHFGRLNSWMIRISEEVNAASYDCTCRRSP
jgi:hypothetical protein